MRNPARGLAHGQKLPRPDLLWIGLPILLYVQARMWLLAGRNEMHQDPVVFGLTDRPSIVAGLLLLVVALAT